MSDKLLYVLYYIAGIPVTYIFYKKCRMKVRNKTFDKEMAWTVGERRFGILISFLSWLGLFSTLITTFTFLIIDWTEKDNNKIAKW